MATRFAAAVIAIWFAVAGLANAADAAARYTKSGFQLPRDRKATVLVAYPYMQINRPGSDGQEVPSPEWNSLAQQSFQASMENSKLPLVVDLKFMTATQAATSSVYPELLAAYLSRTSEMIFQVPQGSPDVTKAKKCRCTYSFADLKDRVLAEFGPADLLLFVNQYDTYATAGQIFGEILGAAAVGAVTPKGTAPPMRRTRTHAGNAILFDLKTGEVIWMHGDSAFGGDLRQPGPAAVRVRQALSGFPGLD